MVGYLNLSSVLAWAPCLFGLLTLGGCSDHGRATFLSLEASIAASQGHSDKAIQLYSEAISLCPDNAETLCDRGGQYYAKGEQQKAIADYQEAIRLAPKASRPHVGLGNVYRKQKDMGAAIASYSKAIELAPTAEHYRQRGIIYRETEEYDSAIQDFSRAIEVMPDDTTSYYQRSLCHKAQGDETKAQEDLAKSRMPREQLRPRRPGEIRKGDWVVVTVRSADVTAGRKVLATLTKGQRCLVKEATASPVLFVETPGGDQGWLRRNSVALAGQL